MVFVVLKESGKYAKSGKMGVGFFRGLRAVVKLFVLQRLCHVSDCTIRKIEDLWLRKIKLVILFLNVNFKKETSIY